MSNSDQYPCFVQVTDDESLENVIELPTEKDGTILLSTVQAQYPNAIGLKYRSSSGAWRGVRLSDNALDPPYEGWNETIYHIALPKTDSVKRKMEESPNREPEAKLVKTGSDSDFLSDLIVLGLPYKASEHDLKEYFQQFGDLAMHEVKYDPVSKESRGFGFIRFKNAASAQKALKTNHSILGRRCEVRMPKKKDEMPLKLFIGRLPDGTSQDDLTKYFTEFGDLTDVYIPNPFRGFGFVTFASSDVARQVLHMTHNLKECRLNVTYAEPKGEVKTSRSSRGGGGGGGGGSRRSQDPPFDFEDMRQLMYNNASRMPPAGYGSSGYSTSSSGCSSSNKPRSTGSSAARSGMENAIANMFNPYMNQPPIASYGAHPSTHTISYPTPTDARNLQYGSYWSNPSK